VKKFSFTCIYLPQDGIRMDLREIGLEGVWSGFSWLRIGTGGGLG
jgi:hypothetical protein